MTRYDGNLDWDETTFRLAILDMESGEIVDTGIPSGHNKEMSKFEYPVFPEPVWSPDGNSLIISANLRYDEPVQGVEMDEEGNKITISYLERVARDLVLIDLENMTAYQLPSEWIPNEWIPASWLLPVDE